MRYARAIPLFLLAAHAAFAQTTSPFEPPKEDLGIYAINGGAGLDTACTYRSAGPLIVKLKVPATMNELELNGDGTLKNPAKLVAAKIIGANARVRFPVYDIDSSAQVQGAQPEIDIVSFNNRQIKTLQGVTNQWTDDTLTIPIGQVRFDSPRSRGVLNELKIDVDQGNIGAGEFWCMNMDWISIEFDAAPPIVLFHGINSDASTWDNADAPGVLDALNNAGVLWDRYSTGSNGRSFSNAKDLRGKVVAFLNPLKSTKVNVIAHSKGGLDAQMMQWLYKIPRVVSLTTFSTPHLGTAAGDLAIIAKDSVDDKVNLGWDPDGWVASYVDTWTFGQGPQLPGLRDLTTYEATAAIGAGRRGNISPTFTIGTDADGNKNLALEVAESAGVFPAIAHYAAVRSWVVTAIVASAPIVRYRTVPGTFYGVRTVLDYRTTIVGYRPNDIVVTIQSAHPPYATQYGNGSGFNHSTIKQGSLIPGILAKILPLR